MTRVETRKNADGSGRSVDKQARLRAMQRQFDPQIDSYRCYFTDVPLELAAGTRRSAEWTHLTAGDETSVVLACKLVNRMQTDLTEGEFEMLVKALPAASTVSRLTRPPSQLNPSSDRGLGQQAPSERCAQFQSRSGPPRRYSDEGPIA
jgi:hypothetical protein